MDVINIHEAKTHLSRLVERAAKGEAFIIAKAGRPLVKVIPFEEAPQGKLEMFGFMKGRVRVPDDFDRMGEQEIAAMFGVE